MFRDPVADNFPMRHRPRSDHALATILLAGFALLGCATTRPIALHDEATVGLASYYASEHHGRRTASGARFDMNAMTAAHRSLPFGSRVRVKNLENGREVVVRINDRGPFRRGRIIDLSYAAARRIHMVGEGTARVRLDVLSLGDAGD
jgi:rare lipoprotein A